MELSEAHTEKWPHPLGHVRLAQSGVPASPMSPLIDDRSMINRIRQRQKRLNKDEITQLIAGYQAGSTTYELAAQFECHRNTVSRHLKRHGVVIRG